MSQQKRVVLLISLFICTILKCWVNSFPGFFSWTISLQIRPFLWLHLSIQCIKLKHFQCVPCIILNLITHKAWGYMYLNSSFISNIHFSAINQNLSSNPLAQWNENFRLYFTSVKNCYGKMHLVTALHILLCLFSSLSEMIITIQDCLTVTNPMFLSLAFSKFI